MKKIFLYGFAFGLTILTLSSCNDGEDMLSDTHVTYFADLKLLGSDFMKINVGDAYNEPGYIATEGEDDITDKVVVNGSVNTNKSDFYYIDYSVSNKDNFSNSVTRTVMVVNPNGFASAYFGGNEFYEYDDAPIVISDNGDGTYTIDDVWCGLYFYFAYPGYEPAYDLHLEAIVKLNDDNTLTQVGSGSWSLSAKPTIASGSYDPENGTVEWTTSNGLSVKLTK